MTRDEALEMMTQTVREMRSAHDVLNRVDASSINDRQVQQVQMLSNLVIAYAAAANALPH